MPYKLLTINYKLMKRIVFATNNQHKLQEIRDILGSDYEVVSLKEIGCDVDIPETGNTLEENALQKAQYVYDHYHVSCFADDTGLEVEALDGAPGVHSARYAEGTDHDRPASAPLSATSRSRMYVLAAAPASRKFTSSKVS